MNQKILLLSCEDGCVRAYDVEGQKEVRELGRGERGREGWGEWGGKEREKSGQFCNYVFFSRLVSSVVGVAKSPAVCLSTTLSS